MSDNQETVWKAIVLLNEGVYKIWALYITWYTWFFDELIEVDVYREQ